VVALTAATILARCASGGGHPLDSSLVGENLLEMLLCIPVMDCGANKGATQARRAPRPPSRDHRLRDRAVLAPRNPEIVQRPAVDREPVPVTLDVVDIEVLGQYQVLDEH